MASNSDAVRKSKIFVWGQIGEMLKEMDPERVLAILQSNPNTSLYNLFRERLRPLLKKLHDNEGNAAIQEPLLEELKAQVDGANNFREISKYMHDKLDDLSIGSSVLGETQNPEAEHDDVTVDDEEENT